MKHNQEKKVKILLTGVIGDWSEQNELSTSAQMECELADMIFDIVIQGETLIDDDKSSMDLNYWLDRFKHYWHMNCKEDEFKTGNLAYDQIKKQLRVA